MSLGGLEGVQTFFTVEATKERQQSKHNFEKTCLSIAPVNGAYITDEKHPLSAESGH